MLPLWKVNGTSLYYEVCGQGTSLVFIHSLGLTHEMFEIQKIILNNRIKLCSLI